MVQSQLKLWNLEKSLFGNVYIQSIVLEFQVGETTKREWKKIIDEQLDELKNRNNIALVPKNIFRNSNYPEVDNKLTWYYYAVSTKLAKNNIWP